MSFGPWQGLRRLLGSSSPRPLREAEDRIPAMTLREWLAHHQAELLAGSRTWMGVKAMKNPLDAWIYQEILHRVRPEMVVEIGSHAGGSTLYLAHLCDLLGRGRVLSIDRDRRGFAVEHPRIETLTGDCRSPRIVAEARRLCRGRSGLVIHDGDHGKEGVRRDLELYASLVTPGSYLIVEDGILDFFPPGELFGRQREGPYAAVQEFLRDHPEFTPDREAERHLLTHNPGGFLRRSEE